MKGLIVINGFYKPETLKYQITRLNEAFSNKKVDLTVYDTQQFNIFIEKGRVVTDLPESDFIIYLDKDKHISDLLERAGYRLFNNSKSIELSDDKMSTYIELVNHIIRMPKSINSPLMYKIEKDCVDITVNRIEKLFKYPLIVKELHGSLGKQVYLIKNRDELIEIREKLKLIPHLYQEFISSSFGKDARIIVIGGKMASCILRKNENDFRSNVELGATAYKFNPPQSFIDTAEKAAKILNLDYCGVDILFSEDNEPILCEVNSNAYFTASEKISGVDIAQIYCDHILKKINEM